MRSLTLFGVRIDDVTEDELEARLLDMCTTKNAQSRLVVTPNPEFLLEARKNETYRSLLNSSALSLPDGVALRFAAAALLDVHNLHRHPGVDVLPLIAMLAQRTEITLVLLGGTDLSLPRTEQYFATLTEGINIISINPGIINETDSRLGTGIVAQLQKIGPCVIAVALGQGKGRRQGKQERVAAFIEQEVPNAHLIIGVGGAFDSIAGVTDRGPVFLRRLGFEWLWRAAREPWRAKRIFRATIVFPITVAYDTLRHGRLSRALCAVWQELRLHFFPRS